MQCKLLLALKLTAYLDVLKRLCNLLQRIQYRPLFFFKALPLFCLENPLISATQVVAGYFIKSKLLED